MYVLKVINHKAQKRRRINSYSTSILFQSFILSGGLFFAHSAHFYYRRKMFSVILGRMLPKDLNFPELKVLLKAYQNVSDQIFENKTPSQPPCGFPAISLVSHQYPWSRQPQVYQFVYYNFAYATLDTTFELSAASQPYTVLGLESIKTDDAKCGWKSFA